MNNDTRLAWPSWETLKRVSGLSRRTISRRIKLLETKGLIVRREGSTGTTIYHLPPPAQVYCEFVDLEDTASADKDDDFLFAVPQHDFFKYLINHGLLEDFFTSAPAAYKRNLAAEYTEWFEEENGDGGVAPPVAAAEEACGPEGVEGHAEEAAQDGGEDPVLEIQAAFDTAMAERIGAGYRPGSPWTARQRQKAAKKFEAHGTGDVANVVEHAIRGPKAGRDATPRRGKNSDEYQPPKEPMDIGWGDGCARTQGSGAATPSAVPQAVASAAVKDACLGDVPDKAPSMPEAATEGTTRAPAPGPTLVAPVRARSDRLCLAALAKKARRRLPEDSAARKEGGAPPDGVGGKK
jgi:hypothetical protein